MSLTKWTNRLAGLPCNRSRGLTRNQEHRPRLSKKSICPERTPNRSRRRLHPACWCFHMRPLPLSLSPYTYIYIYTYISLTLPLFPLSMYLLYTSPFLSRSYRAFYLSLSLTPCFALGSFVRSVYTYAHGVVVLSVFLCHTGRRKFPDSWVDSSMEDGVVRGSPREWERYSPARLARFAGELLNYFDEVAVIETGHWAKCV